MSFRALSSPLRTVFLSRANRFIIQARKTAEQIAKEIDLTRKIESIAQTKLGGIAPSLLAPLLTSLQERRGCIGTVYFRQKQIDEAYTPNLDHFFIPFSRPLTNEALAKRAEYIAKKSVTYWIEIHPPRDPVEALVGPLSHLRKQHRSHNS